MARTRRDPKNPGATRLLQKVTAFMITVIFTPGFFLIQMATVDFGLFNQILICYLFTNLYGNMLLSIKTDTTTRVHGGDGEDCEKCHLPRPTNGWHCQRCDACIVGSNHHCIYLKHCVGRYNYRYYVCFLGHFAALMLYFLFFYVYTIPQKCEWSSLKRLFFPHPLLLTEIYSENVNKDELISKIRDYHEVMGTRLEDTYILYFVVNLALSVCAVPMFYFHFRNVLKGASSYEWAKKADYVKRDRVSNVVDVLGARWYFAVLWPFANSPLPEQRTFEYNEL